MQSNISCSNNNNNNMMVMKSSSSSASKDKQLFDLSLMKEKSLPVKTALFSKQASPFAGNASTPGLDDSSVSSLGSSTSGLQSTGSVRRSLFSKYWVKTGESPENLPSASGPPTAIIEIADDQLSQEESRNADPFRSTDTHTHHNTRATATATATGASPGMPRRSLFSQDTRRSVSLNSLHMVGEQIPETVSTSFNTSPLRHKSEGELKKRPPTSCLRESRFSFTSNGNGSSSVASCGTAGQEGNMKRSSSICSESSCSVVQFDMESTEVRHFLKPAEVHAEDGWTNYFY
ncbi:unnamed protein product [Cylindrotheca closterium]|uniref:Uncharacterized protein n=1 Tax=Cylindrotheca closterium TaxID=2856 RepID=A0AAD2G7R7_9STRA|nr:unnamed protein product [Cylindrotheca closterium]